MGITHCLFSTYPNLSQLFTNLFLHSIHREEHTYQHHHVLETSKPECAVCSPLCPSSSFAGSQPPVPRPTTPLPVYRVSNIRQRGCRLTCRNRCRIWCPCSHHSRLHLLQTIGCS